MTAADQVLAIDCGTQSLRALVFDPHGEIVARARVPYPPYTSPEPGWAEQDPEVWWRALGEATRRVLADPAYPALKPLYAAIRRITGYPPPV